MAKDQAKRYLEHLRDNPKERQALRKAAFAEVVATGLAAGYRFTVKDLEELFKDTGGGPILGYGQGK